MPRLGHQLQQARAGLAEVCQSRVPVLVQVPSCAGLARGGVGVYDPSGQGAALFAFFAGMAESEREYIREKSLEGQASARERGRHGGRPTVVDDDMAAYARTLRAHGVPVPQIARKLVIPSGKNKGQHPSVATVYRILAEDDTTEPTA